MTIWYMIWCMA